MATSPLNFRLNPAGPAGQTGGNPANPQAPPPRTPPPPITPVAPTPTVLEAAADPGMADTTKMTRDYINQIPGAVGETIDVSGGKIRDAYAGAYKSNRVSAARRGVLGTGVEGALNDTTSDAEQRALNTNASDAAIAGRAQAGQMLSNLATQEQARAMMQLQQQQLQLQASAADRAAQQQYFDQLRAVNQDYQQKQPRSYYDDTDPGTVTSTGRPSGSIAPGGVGGIGRVGTLGSAGSTDQPRMRTTLASA